MLLATFLASLDVKSTGLSVVADGKTKKMDPGFKNRHTQIMMWGPGRGEGPVRASSDTLKCCITDHGAMVGFDFILFIYFF